MQPYPQSPGYPMSYPYQMPAAKRPAASVPGLIIATVGAAAAIIGFFTPWYSANGANTKLKDIVTAVKPDGAPGLAHAWFGWLMWVVFGLAAIAAFVAVLPSPAGIALRIIAPLLGLVGAVLVYAALNSVTSKSNASPFDHAGIGLWLTLLGFVVVGVGGAFGGSSA